MRTMQRQELIETFENVIKKSGGEIFGLPNDDMVIIFNNKVHDEILACLVKVRFMFHDDPLIQNAFDLENAGFVKFFELGNGATEFKSLIKANMENSDEPGRREGNAAMRGTAAPVPSFMGGARKLRRELTPAMLAKVQKALSMTDFPALSAGNPFARLSANRRRKCCLTRCSYQLRICAICCCRTLILRQIRGCFSI